MIRLSNDRRWNDDNSDCVFVVIVINEMIVIDSDENSEMRIGDCREMMIVERW
jgi:hypothetical protein